MKKFLVTLLAVSFILTGIAMADDVPTPTKLEGVKIVSADEVKGMLGQKGIYIFDMRKALNYGKGHHVTDRLQQISTAIEEQTTTGSDIATNLESVATLTKQTADSVQHSSEATSNLNNLVQKLQSLISGFKLLTGESSSNTIQTKS